MKYFNYVLSVSLMGLCVYLFCVSKTDFDFVVAFTTMITGIVFFLFAVIEENKEEIKKLHKIIDLYVDRKL